MRVLPVVMVFAMLPGCGHAQTSAVAPNMIRTPDVLYLTTSSNVIAISNAVKVASGLRVGMTKAEADKYLLDHGITQTNIYSQSLDRGRTLSCPYPLASGGADLILEMECSQPPTSGLFGWKNPLLKRAYIGDQGVTIISITLTNGP